MPPVVSTTSISPNPTDEETAAIVAALELAWPRAIIVSTPPSRANNAAWKWSSRWWVARKHVAADRRRP